MAHDALKRRISAVVAIGTGQRDVAQGRRAETVGVSQIIGFTNAPNVARDRIKAPRAARTEGGQSKCVKRLIG